MPVREREVESEVAERGRHILLVRRSPASSTSTLSLSRSVARSLARWHVFFAAPTHACACRQANVAVRPVVLKPRALTLAPILDEMSRFEDLSSSRAKSSLAPDTKVNRTNLNDLRRVTYSVVSNRFRLTFSVSEATEVPI